MIRFFKLSRLVFVLLLIVLAQGGRSSWAAPDYEARCQTVPTRTPTTVLTDTPAPATPTPTLAAPTATAQPATPDVSATAAAPALTPGAASTRLPRATPASLPKSGGDATISLWGGVFLLIGGLALLCLSARAWQRRS